jgi:hypothetical protein
MPQLNPNKLKVLSTGETAIAHPKLHRNPTAAPL